MKKLLLSLTLVFALQITNAQVLTTEDCTALTIGNVGTDVSGATVGQNDWNTYVTSAAAAPNTDFQVVDAGGVNGNVFQITGSNIGTNTRYLYKDLSTQWAGRTAGNDIVAVEYDFFTGPVTTSLNTMRVILFDATGTKYLAGITVKMNTLVVSGLAYYDNTATTGGSVTNYSFGLGASSTTPIVLLPNTWYRFGLSYDMTTGKVVWKEKSGLFNRYVNGASTGTDFKEVNLIAGTATGNTVSAIGLFDNLSVKATNVENLLATKSSTKVNEFSVFPNPSSDVITVSSKENNEITTVQLTDVNGRIVKQNTFDKMPNVQVNIADLSRGIYMMNIVSSKGTITQKIIKN